MKVTSFKLNADERETLERLVREMGAGTISECLRQLIASGARAYRLDKPTRRSRKLDIGEYRNAA
jgi:hypothetical protein